MTPFTIRDSLIEAHREVKRLTSEIIKQKLRLRHRSLLFFNEKIPTSKEKLDLMKERLYELTVERAAVERGIEVMENAFCKSKWHYSDLLLAHLMCVCEENSGHKMIEEARKRTASEAKPILKPKIKKAKTS